MNTYLEHSDCSMSCFFFGFNLVAQSLQRRLSVWPMFALDKKIQATSYNEFNYFNSVPRWTETDQDLTHNLHTSPATIYQGCTIKTRHSKFLNFSLQPNVK